MISTTVTRCPGETFDQAVVFLHHRNEAWVFTMCSGAGLPTYPAWSHDSGDATVLVSLSRGNFSRFLAKDYIANVEKTSAILSEFVSQLSASNPRVQYQTFHFQHSTDHEKRQLNTSYPEELTSTGRTAIIQPRST